MLTAGCRKVRRLRREAGRRQRQFGRALRNTMVPSSVALASTSSADRERKSEPWPGRSRPQWRGPHPSVHRGADLGCSSAAPRTRAGTPKSGTFPDGLTVPCLGGRSSRRGMGGTDRAGPPWRFTRTDLRRVRSAPAFRRTEVVTKLNEAGAPCFGTQHRWSATHGGRATNGLSMAGSAVKAQRAGKDPELFGTPTSVVAHVDRGDLRPGRITASRIIVHYSCRGVEKRSGPTKVVSMLIRSQSPRLPKPSLFLPLTPSCSTALQQVRAVHGRQGPALPGGAITIPPADPDYELARPGWLLARNDAAAELSDAVKGQY
jgi:hypothetical protein